MYGGNIRQKHNTNVATIGGKGHPPYSIGTFKECWSDDNGVGHEFLIKGVLYFQQSTINILSITNFARQLKDKD